jgi:hypothetical protein
MFLLSYQCTVPSQEKSLRGRSINPFSISHTALIIITGASKVGMV